MSRSLKKGPYISNAMRRHLTKVVDNTASMAPLSTWDRSCVIVPEMTGRVYNVHNGHKMVPVSVSEEMIGCKLGEFAPTRTFRGHAGNKKGKK